MGRGAGAGAGAGIGPGRGCRGCIGAPGGTFGLPGGGFGFTPGGTFGLPGGRFGFTPGGRFGSTGGTPLSDGWRFGGGTNGTELVNGGTEFVKGGTALVKGGTELVKGGTRFVKGGTRFVNGGTVFVNGGTRFVKGGTRLVNGGTRLVKGIRLVVPNWLVKGGLFVRRGGELVLVATNWASTCKAAKAQIKRPKATGSLECVFMIHSTFRTSSTEVLLLFSSERAARFSMEKHVPKGGLGRLGQIALHIAMKHQGLFARLISQHGRERKRARSQGRPRARR